MRTSLRKMYLSVTPLNEGNKAYDETEAFEVSKAWIFQSKTMANQREKVF